MRIGIRASLVAVVLVALSRVAPAQDGATIPRGMIDGIVTDSSLTPIAGATISLLGTTIKATTGGNGRFRIVALPAGEYVVMARRIGYASASTTLHLDGGDTLRTTFALRPVPPELDTVRASAVYAVSRLGEFEERRARAIGHFITAEDIYKRNPVHAADMLRTVLSVGVGGKWPNYSAYSLRGGFKDCAFAIFVDGALFSETGDLTFVPTPTEIAGVEIYSGPATIPLQYKREKGCGAILIWTKSG